MNRANMLTKSLSCNEIWTKQAPDLRQSQASHNDEPSVLIASKRHKSSDKLAKAKNESHKTVIYFGDSISSKKQHNQLQQQQQQLQQPKMQQIKPPRFHVNLNRSENNIAESADVKHAKRLCDEMIFKHRTQLSGTNNAPASTSSSNDKAADEIKTVKSEMPNVKHLKTVLEEKCKNNSNVHNNDVKCAEDAQKSGKSGQVTNSSAGEDKNLPSFVESIVNGVINIKIDGSYDVATKLVRSLESGDIDDENGFDDIGNEPFLDVGGELNTAYLDWSFVQDWRSR